jgi:2-polyprenyl-3-methyl-5-hydroxy-6-metoxy-1,4-benzoquinol methylase
MSDYENNLNQTWSEMDPFTVDRYLQFSKFIEDGNCVLDIGCNTGRGGQVLKNIYPNLNLFGIDLIHERIDKIPKGIYLELFNESIVTANCSGNKFDVIVGGEIIEHIPEFLFIDMLYNCNSMLKNNGLMIFTTPNPNSLLVKLGRTKVFDDPSHVNILSISKIKKILNSCNFKIRQIEGSGKVSRYIGFSFPINLYGSYLIVIQKQTTLNIIC